MYIQNGYDSTTSTIAGSPWNGDENEKPVQSTKDVDFQSTSQSRQNLPPIADQYYPTEPDHNHYLSNGATSKNTTYDVNDADNYTYDDSADDNNNNNNGSDEVEPETETERGSHDETWKISHEVKAYIEYLERQLQIHQTPPHSPELAASTKPVLSSDQGTSRPRNPSMTSETQKYISHLEANLQTQIESSANQVRNLRTLNANLMKENRALKWEVLEWKGKVDGERERGEGEVGGLKRRIRELEGRVEEDEGFIREMIEKGDGRGSWELGTGDGDRVVEMEREIERLRGLVEEDRRVILELQDENEGLRYGSLKGGRGIELDLGRELELEGEEEEMEEGCYDGDEPVGGGDVSGEQDNKDEDEIEDQGEDASVGLGELESKMLSMSIEHLKEQVEHLLLFCR